MRASEPLGNNYFHRLTEELLASISKEFFSLGVDEVDLAVLIYNDHGIGGRFQQSPKFLLGFLAPGNIARGGEHAQHVAFCVLVNRGVVEYVGQRSIGMPDSEWIVRGETFREDTLVAFTCFFRLREIVGKVRSNQFFAGRSGDLNGGFVYIGDFSLWADGYQRINACFDQASGAYCVRRISSEISLEISKKPIGLPARNRGAE